MIQNEFVRVFPLFAPGVKHFRQKHSWKKSQIMFI